MLRRLKKIYFQFEIKFNPIKIFFDRVEEHHLYLIAAGIAFNILLYLMPLMLVAVYIVNIIVGVDVISGELVKTLDSILPPNTETTDFIQSTLKEVNLIFGKSTYVGWIGIISLLWLSSTLISSLRSGLNRIFDAKTPKMFFIYRIKDIFLILLMTILFIISSYLVPVYSVFQTMMTSNLKPPYNWYLSNIFVVSVSLFTSFMMFFIIFKFLPNKKMPKFIVFLSTFISVVCIEISRNLFSWYIIKFGTYGKFYGAYAVLVSIAFWVYYLTLIILLSAELSQYIDEIRQARKFRKLI